MRLGAKVLQAIWDGEGTAAMLGETLSTERKVELIEAAIRRHHAALLKVAGLSVLGLGVIAGLTRIILAA